jgi:hypothetical protein
MKSVVSLLTVLVVLGQGSLAVAQYEPLPTPYQLQSYDAAPIAPGLSLVQTLGLFVGLPILLFVVIAALVVVGEKSRKQHG